MSISGHMLHICAHLDRCDTFVHIWTRFLIRSHFATSGQRCAQPHMFLTCFIYFLGADFVQVRKHFRSNLLPKSLLLLVLSNMAEFIQYRFSLHKQVSLSKNAAMVERRQVVAQEMTCPGAGGLF